MAYQISERRVEAGETSRTSLPRLTSLAVDVALLGAVFAATNFGASDATLAPTLRSWLVFSVTFVAVMALRGFYRDRLQTSAMDEVAGVLFAGGLASVATLAEWQLAGAATGAGQDVLRLFVFTAVYVGSGRIALLRMIREARLAGQYMRPTLIVGAGRVGRLVARRLVERPELGMRPIGYLDKDPLGPSPDGDPVVPVLGASWDLENVVAAHGVEQVVIAFSTAPDDVILRLVRRCDELGVNVAYVPRFFERITRRVTVDHLGGLPFVSACTPDPRGIQFAIKYAVDRIVAAMLLMFFAPLIGAAALAIRIRMGRPVFFRQRRVGLDGQEFEIMKLRSMTIPEDPGVEPSITPLGSFLRRTSIDELPQLFNVLRGEMSLIGPRPERPELAEQFARQIYRYDERHRTKCGITGWAQVHGLGRGPARFGERALAERVEWDNYYIENWSLLLDLKILFLTMRALLKFAQSDNGKDHVDALGSEEEPAPAPTPVARTAA